MSTVGDAYEDDMFEDANSGSFDVQEEHSPPHERHSCGTALPRSAAADMMNTLRSYEASPFPVHQAAWDNNKDALMALISGKTPGELAAMRDVHGNTPLHVAAIRGSKDAVVELLAAGLTADTRSARGWVPLLEAADARHREVALELARAEVMQMRASVRNKKQALLAELRALPDMCLTLSWQVASNVPGLSALLRKYAPHDTYTLWKKGDRLRVDGSLMGIRDDAPGIMPQWKRGHFSLLYDATEGSKGKALFVNHASKRYIDVKTAKKKMGAAALSTSGQEQEQVKMEAAALEAEVDGMLLAPGVEQSKARSAELKFKPAEGWLSKEVREKVSGWDCKVYEASGKMIASTTFKEPWAHALAPHTLADAPWEAYLSAQLPADVVLERAVNPLNPSSIGKDKDRTRPPPKGHTGAAARASSAPHADADADAEAGWRADEEAAELAALEAALAQDDEASSAAVAVACAKAGCNDRQAVNAIAEQADGAGPGPECAQGACGDAERRGSSAGAGPSSSSAGTGHAAQARDAQRAAMAQALRDAAVAAALSRPRPGAAEAAAAAGPKYGPPGSGAKKARKFNGRCWMASDFPLSLKQLLPLLEVIGSANKVLARVGRFMAKYGEMDMFPVQVQVPLLLSVYVELGFRSFTLLPTESAAAAAHACDRQALAPAAKKSSRLWGSSNKPSAAPQLDPACLLDAFYRLPPGYTQSSTASASDMGESEPMPALATPAAREGKVDDDKSPHTRVAARLAGDADD